MLSPKLRPFVRPGPTQQALEDGLCLERGIMKCPSDTPLPGRLPSTPAGAPARQALSILLSGWPWSWGDPVQHPSEGFREHHLHVALLDTAALPDTWQAPAVEVVGSRTEHNVICKDKMKLHKGSFFHNSTGRARDSCPSKPTARRVPGTLRNQLRKETLTVSRH